MTEQQSPNKGLSTTMAILAWGFAIGILAWMFHDWQTQSQKPVTESSGGINSVSIPAGPFGHYRIKGSINGIPVNFLVDTGATSISIPADLGNKLVLSKGLPYRVSTANGNIQVNSTRIDRLQFGSIQLTNLNAHLNPGMSADQDVLLGMSALKQLEFTQSNGWLTIRQNP